MVDDQEKKEESKYEEVDPWKLVTEVPQALLATVAVAVMVPLGWFLTIFDEDLEPEFKRDPKLKILRSIITTSFWNDLNDRELKIACHIFSSPWIYKDREKTIKELEKILISGNLEKNKLLIKKYLDPLFDRQIFVLRNNLFFEGVPVDHPDTEFKHFKWKKLRKSWIKIMMDDYETHIKCHEFSNV